VSAGAIRPLRDERSAAYWDAARGHQLTAARCSRCQRFVSVPEDICANCGSADPEFRFEPVSGRGVVRSWAVVHQSFLPSVDVPFVLVDVELDDQPDLRVIARLVDGPGAVVALGSTVNVAFDDVPDGESIPVFALDAVAADGSA